MGQKIKPRHGRHPKPRNWEAKEMITSGVGRKQVFKDKRDKRSQDHSRSWQADWDT